MALLDKQGMPHATTRRRNVKIKNYICLKAFRRVVASSRETGFICSVTARQLRRYILDHFVIDVSEQEIKRERDKSRELRRSRWWQNRLALGLCHWCGGRFPAEELTMDHVIPLTRGGKGSRNNVVPACKECNSRKKYLLPMEWED